jgi:hypothetical protein
VYNPEGGQCWRRQRCNPTEFWHQVGQHRFTIYVKVVTSASSIYAPYYNQKTNQGAIDIDAPEIDDMAPGFAAPSEDACQRWCTDAPRCDCAVYHTEVRQCWRRHQCNASQFLYAVGFTVYMKKNRSADR